MNKVNEVAPEVSTGNKVNDESTVNEACRIACNIKEAAPEVSYSTIKEVELHIAHNVQVEIIAEALEEQNGAKVQVEKSGMKEVKFDVNTKAMEGSSVKEVMQSDGLTMMKKNEQSRCANWDPGEPVDAKDQMEMLDVEEAEILVNINKVGLQLFMKEVWSSGGTIEKALLIVMFLLKERFVNSFSPLSVIELSDYG